MAASAQTQVRALARAVAMALATSDLTDEDRKPRQLAYVDLPWQVPPILTPLKLGSVGLQHFFDSPLNVGPEKLIKFWSDTLSQMWFEPSRCMHLGTFSNLRTTMASTKRGVRAFRFSTPIGHPGQLAADAGILLSLEVAHAAYISLPVRDRVCDNRNYYTVLADDTIVGVKDGRPAIESPWELDGSGMIPDYLEMSRGPADFTCHYDQIASVRSLVYEHRNKFKRDFDALDQALQALRVLSFGTYCPDLLSAVQVAPLDAGLWKDKEQALWDAREVMTASISDRAKLQTLRALLVPAVMGVSRFRREIFSKDEYPFALAPAKSQRISEYLREFYESEVPCNLRRTA